MKKIIFLFALFSFGCASPRQLQKPKNYSQDTILTFNHIEKSGSLYLNKPNDSDESQIARNTSSVKSNLNDKTKQLIIEINQKLTFFCMSKVSKFSSEKKCQEFTKKVSLSCEKTHSNISTSTVSCIQRNLKKIKI